MQNFPPFSSHFLTENKLMMMMTIAILMNINKLQMRMDNICFEGRRNFFNGEGNFLIKLFKMNELVKKRVRNFPPISSLCLHWQERVEMVNHYTLHAKT